MVKVGDKVIVVSVDLGYNCSSGDVLEVSSIDNPYGFWAKTPHGEYSYARTKEMMGSSDVIVKPYTETEAERRGAKFGVMGVYNPTGQRAVVASTDKVNTPDSWPEKERWIVSLDGSLFTHEVYAENIRLDHEPEYVAWSEAPEHLRYDSSQVYYDGETVKWIAKPEGAFVDVAVVLEDGSMEFSTKHLTVKL